MLILDAGAFIAAERGSNSVAALIKRERAHGRVPLTNGAVVAQVWRGGNGRQAPLARLLPSVEVIPVDDHLGRRGRPAAGAGWYIRRRRRVPALPRSRWR
jgi:hypothetical protein